PDELKDAMVTLHPQPAMEHLHHRFVAAGGNGSDAMIAFEATEVASTHRSRSLVPVRPAEPLAGAPDKSPIPLADNVTGGVAAVQASATRARSAAGGAVTGLVHRAQDLLPHRRTAYRRVTPAAARRETQRRAALAVLAFVVVLSGLGMFAFAFNAGTGGKEELSSVAAGEAALRTINDSLNQVFAPGVNLVEGDPQKAYQLLSAAWTAFDTARTANVPETTLAPLRAKAVGGLDELFKVIPVAPARILTTAGQKTPFDIGALVRGPQGVPFVLDKATSSVYRVDPTTKKATLVFRSKLRVPAGTEGIPKLITTPYDYHARQPMRDLVIVDSKNVVWRWRPRDQSGVGTTTKTRVEGAAGWGDDVTAIGTFVRDASAGLYNVYVVDPSEQNILSYTPSKDGSGYPISGQPWLSVARDVSGIRQLLIDGDIYVLDNGTIIRYVGGRTDGWTYQAPGTTSFAPDGDTLLRAAPTYQAIASSSDKRTGLIYAWDAANGRVVAIDKAKGTFVAQYRLAGGSDLWRDVRGMYVIPGVEADDPATLIWATKDSVMSARLERVADDVATPGPSGSPGATPSGSPKPSAAPRRSGAASPRP
ncbi:MAG TPA: hypothetical protein VFJ71_01045, partial [Candidatus Limnocylindrales bacterium]|nr:hypothetical protein [Candidatus Limnocylindrales bacterium]